MDARKAWMRRGRGWWQHKWGHKVGTVDAEGIACTVHTHHDAAPGTMHVHMGGLSWAWGVCACANEGSRRVFRALRAVAPADPTAKVTRQILYCTGDVCQPHRDFRRRSVTTTRARRPTTCAPTGDAQLPSATIAKSIHHLPSTRIAAVVHLAGSLRVCTPMEAPQPP
jgi:hypothetical protein